MICKGDVRLYCYNYVNNYYGGYNENIENKQSEKILWQG